jgi:3-dehydroquinate synthase
MRLCLTELSHMDTRKSYHSDVVLQPFLTNCRWSPYHELQPNPPLRHGHAISIDMAYTATLAYDRGMLSQEEHTRLLKLFSRAGLCIDHPLYDDSVIEKGTEAILKTRDGSLRLAVPSPLGQCKFVNEYTVEDLQRVLKVHKEHTAQFPRSGAGKEAYVDSSDTGETMKGSTNGVNGHSNGTNGHSNGTNGVKAHANGVNGVNGINGVNGHTNGVNGVSKT